jgi:pyruvate ferredoxin oxidoreductase delta subunit
VAKTIDQIGWKDLEVGCVIVDPGNARSYHTGSWRSERPVWEFAKCNQCALCWLHCPDAAIFQREDGYYEANLDYCKGCGICKEVCPKDCISMIEEP